MRCIVSGKKGVLVLVLLCVLGGLILSAGIARSVSALPSRVPVPILMYHSVGYNRKTSKYILSPEDFEEDLRWLSERGYRSVSVSELVAYVNGKGDLPERPVVITLDDGYLNNLTYVLPLLERYGMKATVSVVGSFCETYTRAPDPNPAYAYLTWSDVETLVRSGRIEIGNHTYGMHSVEGRKGCMRRADESVASYSAALMSDLSRLQSMLAEQAGVIPTVFAYPYGAVSEEAVYVLQALGFRAALTCSEKINYLSRGDGECLYRLGRFNRPSGESTGAFMKRVMEGEYG